MQSSPFRSLAERCPLINLPNFSDERGILSVASNSFLPFPMQRAFWIYDVPSKAERGGHAHRTCSELLFAISGSFDVELTDGVETMTVRLDTPHRGLLIPAMVWCRIFHFSPGGIALCLASQEFDAQGYIHSFEKYVEEVEKNTAK